MTNEELKPNMYVRTKNGRIAKYLGKNIKFHEFDNYIIPHYEYYDECLWLDDFDKWFKNDLLKASFNLIDLIEVGDYVNGKDVWFNEDFNCLVVGDNEYYMPISYDNFLSRYGVEEIETIVTKEQMEAIQYVVK